MKGAGVITKADPRTALRAGWQRSQGDRMGNNSPWHLNGDALFRREGSAQQMGKVYGKALRWGSNQSQAKHGCAVMSYCVRHGIEHIVGLGVGTRGGHNCFLPSVRVKSHLLLPRIYSARCRCQTVRTSTTARSHDTSKDAILLTHSHLGAVSEPHSVPPTCPLYSPSLPLAAVRCGCAPITARAAR
jgi:hypothetical protein